ncbi:hypothetical protein FYJ31_03050 [Bifidobacterium sp. WCA-178-WT-4B]|nr:hypothetical protein [Bifidobacterium sp. WCA-178-WT-4B]
MQVIIPNTDASTGETLIMPVTALIASAGSAYAVEAVRGGKLVRVPVSIGLVSDAQVQITKSDGLKAGDKVVVS